VLRLPSGNEDNFQGTGTTEVAPMLYASSASAGIGRWLQVRGYLNGGVNFNTDDVDQSEGRYGVGLDLGIADRVTGPWPCSLGNSSRGPRRRGLWTSAATAPGPM